MCGHMIPLRRRPFALLLAVALVLAACGGSIPDPTPPTGSSPGPAGSPSPSPSAVARPSITPSPSPGTGESEDLDGAADASARPPVATRSPAARPSPTATEPPAVPAQPYAVNLARSGDYVRQYTFEWCVGASIQMTLNMLLDEDDTTRATQQRVWEMARDRSFSPFGGANPVGWVATLNELDVGPYELVSIPTYEEALRTAATALAETERPVGLVMWRGRHAWVMSGFEATADPRTTDAFEIIGIRVQDPLHPHGSSVWGPSPTPNSLVTPAVLGEQFVIRDRGRVNLGVPPGYLLVLPTEA